MSGHPLRFPLYVAIRRIFKWKNFGTTEIIIETELNKENANRLFLFLALY